MRISKSGVIVFSQFVCCLAISLHIGVLGCFNCESSVF